MTTYNFYSMVAVFTTAAAVKHSILFHVQSATKEEAQTQVKDYIENESGYGPPLHGIAFHEEKDMASYPEYTIVLLCDLEDAAKQYKLEIDRLNSLYERLNETQEAIEIIRKGIGREMSQNSKEYAVIGGIIWKNDEETAIAKAIGEV